MQPILFYVLVKPRRAPKRIGSIVLAEETRESQEATNTIGQIVSLGSLAFKAKTPGLDYAEERNVPKPGDWVRYSKHAGQQYSVKTDGEDDDKYVVITDTDILGIVPEAEVDKHRGWV